MPAPTRQPAILSEAGAHADWIARPLLDAGFTLNRCALHEVAAGLDSGAYNVLLIGRYYSLRRTRQQEQEMLAELRRAVARFLAAGGGVFFAHPSGGVLEESELLADYGVELRELGITETDGALVHSRHGLYYREERFAWTDVVDPPFAADVPGVWYPEFTGGHKAARPVVGDEHWRPVLSTAASARSRPLVPGQGNKGMKFRDDAAAELPGPVPILQVREVGAGRLAVCGIPSGFHIDSPHNFPLARQVLCTGFDGRPSGFQRLLLNLCAWLAEPSMAGDELGGATTEPDVLRPQVPTFPDDPPVAWANPSFPPDCTPRRGLVGARTAYSGASGTVAEYAERARAAGLDFLVFLEDFDQLDPETLEALKADCLAASTDDFFAVAGFTATDVSGAHYFQYGDGIVWPREDILDASGRHLGPKPLAGGTKRARSFDAAHLAFTFGDCAKGIRRGRWHHAENPQLLPDHRFCDSIALVTWQDGCIIDDVRDQYGRLEAKCLRLNPVAIALMTSPDDLDRAAAEAPALCIIEPYADMPDQVLRKHMAPELEWWGMLDEEDIRHPRFRFRHWQGGHPFQYISDGPLVQAWTASVTSRDPEWRAADTEVPPVADWFRVDAAHFRLRLRASSAVGIAEVILHDGERRLRRWDGGGAERFETELDFVHDRQMQLWLEVRDQAGGQAICRDYRTLRRDWCEFYCGDRNNPLQIGYEKDARGLAFGWAGTMYLTYNCAHWGGTMPFIGRWWYYGDKVFPVPADPVHDVVTPADGGVGSPGPGLALMPQLPADLDPPELGLMLEPSQELISTDVTVNDFRCDHGFDRSEPWFYQEYTGFGLFPAHPTRYVNLERRAWVFRPRPHSLTTLIYEHRLRWRRRPELAEPLRVGWLSNASAHVFYRADGSVLRLSGQDDQPFSITWRRGEALVSWLDGRRPAIFINDGEDVELWRDTRNPPGEKVGMTNPQGRELVLRLPPACADRAVLLRFIAVGGTHNHTDAGVYGWFRAAMGLAGEPAYALELRQGRVLSQALFLDLDSDDHGVAFRIPRVELPMALPILVRNLNDDWTTVLYDRDARRWRPLGCHEFIAYATLDTNARDWNVYLGHPVVATQRQLVLNFCQIADDRFRLEAHNPGRRPITARVRPARHFDLLAWSGEDLTLPPGSSQIIDIDKAR